MIREFTTNRPVDHEQTKADLDYLEEQLALKADIASPTFTGNPKAPTAIPGDNDTSIATTAFTTAALAAFLTTITASDVSVAKIGSATYDKVQERLDMLGTGRMSGGTISDAGAGAANVAAVEVLIRATDSDTAQVLSATVPAVTSLALTNLSINYIYAEYNAGTPQIVATTTVRTDYNTNVLLGNVYRSGTTLHISNTRRYNIGNAVHLVERRLQSIQPMEWESGAAIGETGTRNLTLTVGAFWDGTDRFTTTAKDTSVADTFRYFYRDGVGGFTEVAASTQIDNLQYDDGTGTLATLGNSRYGVHWVYLGSDSDLYVVYGHGSYLIASAQDVQPPATVPPHIEGHGRLIGKIIVQKSAAALHTIESSFTTHFTGSVATDHTSLLNIGTNTHAQIDTFISEHTLNASNLMAFAAAHG